MEGYLEDGVRRIVLRSPAEQISGDLTRRRCGGPSRAAALTRLLTQLSCRSAASNGTVSSATAPIHTGPSTNTVTAPGPQERR